MPASLWASTAAPANHYPALAGERSTEVAIIGAGYTGLSAALHAAEKGHDVLVLDAAEPGWGASGRNGGQVAGGVKHTRDELERTLGSEKADKFLHATAHCGDLVFELINRHGIACDARRLGKLQCASDEAGLIMLTQQAHRLAEQGVSVAVLGKDEIDKRVGGGGYIGGYFEPRVGAVQPLSFARGLARAAEKFGARIFSRSRAIRLRREGDRWVIVTQNGTVRATSVILATDGYTDGLWPRLSKSLISIYSFQIATRPLTDRQRSSILPGGEVASDTRHLLRYFSTDATGRLLMGGRTTFSDPPTAPDGRQLASWIEDMFPQLGTVAYEFLWSGRIAMTRDHIPHLHELAPSLYAGLGYNGSGVAMGVQMGQYLAQLVDGVRPPDLPFPVTPLKPFPFHSLHRPVGRAILHYYRLHDRWRHRTAAT